MSRRPTTLMGGCALLGARRHALAGACGAPPWRMGTPLDGRPSIPPRAARETPAESRAAAAAARRPGQPVLELAALERARLGPAC